MCPRGRHKRWAAGSRTVASVSKAATAPFGLDHVREAHSLMESGGARGKLVVLPWSGQVPTGR